MTAFALLITLPEDWTERIATMLGDRLADKELPPGLEMALVLPSVDGEAHSATVKAWYT